MYRYLKRKIFETMFHHPQQEAKRYYYQKRETFKFLTRMDPTYGPRSYDKSNKVLPLSKKSTTTIQRDHF